jgi:chlorite dismutase
MLYQLIKITKIGINGNFIIIKESNDLSLLLAVMNDENKKIASFPHSNTKYIPFIKNITYSTKKGKLHKGTRLTFPLEQENYHYIKPKQN